jgi:hypothetical protein
LGQDRLVGESDGGLSKNTSAPEGRATEDSDGERGRGRSTPEGRPTGEPITREQVGDDGAPYAGCARVKIWCGRVGDRRVE